jgi:hypothetical protein
LDRVGSERPVAVPDYFFTLLTVRSMVMGLDPGTTMCVVESTVTRFAAPGVGSRLRRPLHGAGIDPVPSLDLHSIVNWSMFPAG